jgi:hypothetical protein
VHCFAHQSPVSTCGAAAGACAPWDSWIPKSPKARDLGHPAKDLAVFLFGFAKNDLENIDRDDLLTAREIASDWLAADDERLKRAIAEGEIQELYHDDEKA